MYRYAIGQPNGSPYYLIPIQYYNNILKNDQIKKNQVKVRELYLDQFTAVRNTKSIQTWKMECGVCVYAVLPIPKGRE